MAKMTKEQRLQAVHDEAMREFDRVQTALRDERRQCLQDRRFYSIAGAQWEGPLGEQFENKPRLEFNRTHLSVFRIINEYLNNRIAVEFVPVDGEKNDLADVCAGLYRADEQDSGAQEAYDNAFEEAVGGGFGAWRLRAEYEDEEDDEDERQRIRIEPIHDADSSVFFDLDAKRQDKADAKRCWVLSAMTRESFRDEYGHDPASISKQIHQREFDWSTPDVVYIAEYYRVENIAETVHVYLGLDGEELRVTDSELEEDEDKAAELAATGYKEVRQKKVKRRRVHKYIISGAGVEEDCGLIAGKHIPIVPVYGKRWFVDNVERCMGHVRLAKDAQRLTNSLLSWLTEMSARFDVEKPILTPEQIVGHTSMWAEDNITRYPYLLINALRDVDGNPQPAGPVGYTKAPQIPPAMAALIQVAGQALDDLTGAQQAGEKVGPNQSGHAIELVQNRLDMQSYIYMDNMSKAVKRSGEIWLSMAKDVMPEPERKMKTVTTDGTPGSVTLKRPIMTEAGERLENDLDDAKFNVWVQVGPTSSSRRNATVRALTGVAQITQDPEIQQLLMATIVNNLEGEGIQDVRDYCRRKLILMGAVKPTEEEAQEMAATLASKQPDPQSQAMLAMAEQAQADAQAARAKVVDTLAAADLKRAQTEKATAEAQATAQKAGIEVVDAVSRHMPPLPVIQAPPM